MDEAKRRENLRDAATTLKQMLEPGLLGHFTWFEAIEITTFETTKGSEKPASRNVFSIFVAESGEPPPPPANAFLSKPKTLRGLESRRFGISKQPVSAQQVLAALGGYAATGVWQPFEVGPLQVGRLNAPPHVFCPADTRTEVPLNAVLKNNFWAGSYVVELRDDAKTDLEYLVENDSMFEELSAWLETILPFDIARVPDRIGNLIFQVPSQAVIAEFHRRHNQPMEVRLAWEPSIKPRPVSGEFRVEQDGMVVSIARFDFPAGRGTLDVPMTGGDIRFSVWDDERKILLAASSVLNASDGRFSIESTTSIGIAQPRRFEVEGPGGVLEPHSIPLMEPMGGWRPHRQPRRPQETDWRAKRALQASMKRLLVARSFIQYGIGDASPQDERERALEDLRALIRAENQGAIYLWDPYLSADDILNTLAFCTTAGTELRALTAGETPINGQKIAGKTSAAQAAASVPPLASAVPPPPTVTTRQAWVAAQKLRLDTAFIGDANLKLEYRMSWGVKDSFHDRFLMFPGLGRARSRVWSLGASLNHIGSQHCIVQEVSYPEPVLEAFLRFWDGCAETKHLIWKYS